MNEFQIRFGMLALAAVMITSPLPAQAPAASTGGPPRGMPRGPVMTTDFNDHSGFTQIFDGKSLAGWDGAPEVWRVKDGAIVGESTKDKPTGTTFIIYKGSEPADFDLKFELKLEGTGGNSGIQYRSRQELPAAFPPRPASAGGPGGPGGGPGGGGPGGPPQGAQGGGPGGGAGGPGGEGNRPPGFMSVTTYQKWNVKGYQNDQGLDGRSNGNLWEGGRFAGERGTMTSVGQIVEALDGSPNVLLGTAATPDEAAGWWKKGDWNQEEIIARGNVLTHLINGHLITQTIDDNAAKRTLKGGVIAIQIESGGDFKVSTRNLWLKTIP